MELKDIRLGFAICGSFCTFDAAFTQLSRFVVLGCDVTPIFSETAYATDTRFGTARCWVERAEALCGKSAVHTIAGAEPIGPKKLLDAIVVAPCTGNTLGKLAAGITDSSVTMAVKAHLRNGRPVVLAVSTNDALAASAPNIGQLMGRKNIYFAPLRQDDAFGKPCSLVADMDKLPDAVQAALNGEQYQPFYGL